MTYEDLDDCDGVVPPSYRDPEIDLEVVIMGSEEWLTDEPLRYGQLTADEEAILDEILIDIEDVNDDRYEETDKT